MPRLTVARLAVAAGLAVQVIAIAAIVFMVGVGKFVEYLVLQRGDAVTAVVFWAFVAILVAALAIGWPVVQGRPWSLKLATALMAALLGLAYRNVAHDFAYPQNYGNWLLSTTMFWVAAVALAFAVVAVREVRGHGRRLGRMGPVQATGRAALRFSQGRQAAILLGALGVWTGMAVVGLAVSQAPVAGATFAEAPAAMVTITMRDMRFVPATIAVAAGQPTALFFTNQDGVYHDFVVDTLGVSLRVAPGTTAVTVVTPGAGGTLPYYCSVPGHREAGMVGTLNVQ